MFYSFQATEIYIPTRNSVFKLIIWPGGSGSRLGAGTGFYFEI